MRLNELADAIAAEMDRRVADEREKCRKAVRKAILDLPQEQRAIGDICDDVIAHAIREVAAIRAGGGE